MDQETSMAILSVSEYVYFTYAFCNGDNNKAEGDVTLTWNKTPSGILGLQNLGLLQSWCLVIPGKFDYLFPSLMHSYSGKCI